MKNPTRARQKHSRATNIWFLQRDTLKLLLLYVLIISPVRDWGRGAPSVVNFMFLTGRLVKAHEFTHQPNQLTQESTPQPNQQTQGSTNQPEQKTQKSTPQFNQQTLESTNQPEQKTQESTPQFNQQTQKPTPQPNQETQEPTPQFNQQTLELTNQPELKTQESTPHPKYQKQQESTPQSNQQTHRSTPQSNQQTQKSTAHPKQQTQESTPHPKQQTYESTPQSKQQTQESTPHPKQQTQESTPHPKQQTQESMDQLKTPVIGVDEKLQRNATELMETRASEVVMTDSPWNLTGYQGAQIGPTEANSNQTIGQLGKVKSPHTLEIHQTGRHIKDSAKAHSIPSEDALKIYKNYEKTEIPLVSRVTNTSSSGMLSLDTTWMPRTENMTKGSPTFERMVKRSLSSNRTKNDSTESAEGDFLSLITNTTERVGESLQTYDATGTTRADKTDADLQSLVTPRNPQSCAHRCTDDTNFPCSCDEKCVVYKTCCADFAQTCAGLFRRAVTKFRNLLFAAVRCDALTSVIVVESCPPTSPEEMHPSDIEGIDLEAILSTGVSYDKLSPSEDESLDTYSLSGILSNAPVTDYETGIIYANTSIYECNTGNTISGSSQSSDDIKGTWKTQIGTFSEEFENKVSNTQAKLDFSTYSFVPPTTHPAAAGSLCFSNWTLTCIAQMSSRLGLGLVTCNTSVNEYYRLRSVFPTLPLPDLHTSHLVCAICLADFQKLTGNGHRFFIHGFKTLMSISDVPGYVEYSFQENSVRFEKPIPWSKWRCSIPDKAITQNYGQCTTLQCNSLFLLLPNGECKKAAATEIAIQEDLLFKGKLCRLDPAAFANAAKCYLDGFHGLKMSSKPLRSYRDTRTSRPANFTTNRNLIIIKTEMYFKTAAFDTEIWNLQTGYFRFFAAMMIFAQNYCSKNETAQDISSKAVTASPPIDIESTDIATLWPIGTNVTATDVLSCFIFSYCFNIHDANVNLFNDLDCEITSEIRTPSSYIQVGEMFSEVLDLQCLGESYDVSDLVSKGCKVFSQHITMHCFALLLFLFGFNGALPCGYLSF